MIDYVIIGILTFVIVLLLADRYFIVEQAQKEKDKLLEELSRAIKAVISRNANDYVMTSSIDKLPTEQRAPLSPDEIPEEVLSDDQFFEAVGKGLKEDKK